MNGGMKTAHGVMNEADGGESQIEHPQFIIPQTFPGK